MVRSFGLLTAACSNVNGCYTTAVLQHAVTGRIPTGDLQAARTVTLPTPAGMQDRSTDPGYPHAHSMWVGPHSRAQLPTVTHFCSVPGYVPSLPGTGNGCSNAFSTQVYVKHKLARGTGCLVHLASRGGLGVTWEKVCLFPQVLILH